MNHIIDVADENSHEPSTPELALSLGRELAECWKNETALDDEQIYSGVKAILGKTACVVHSTAIDRAMEHNRPSVLGKKPDEACVLSVIVHGECHWSMLYYFKNKPQYVFHYDSITHYNEKKAIDVIRFLKTIGWVSIDAKMAQPKHRLAEPTYVQQKGSFECGYFAILSAFLMHWQSTTYYPQKPINLKKIEPERCGELIEKMFEHLDFTFK